MRSVLTSSSSSSAPIQPAPFSTPMLIFSHILIMVIAFTEVTIERHEPNSIAFFGRKVAFDGRPSCMEIPWRVETQVPPSPERLTVSPQGKSKVIDPDRCLAAMCTPHQGVNGGIWTDRGAQP